MGGSTEELLKNERFQLLVPKCPIHGCKEPLICRQPHNRFQEDDNYVECPNGHVWELTVTGDTEPAAIRALVDAEEEQQVVTFLYRKRPNENGEIRTISAYEVTGDIVESDCKVLGWDHDRNAIRSFSTNKIAGPVEVKEDVEFKEPKHMNITDLIKADVEARDEEPRKEKEREERRIEARREATLIEAREVLSYLHGWSAKDTNGFPDDPGARYIDADRVRFKIDEWTFTVLQTSPDVWAVYADTIRHERIQRECADPPQEEDRKVEVLIERLADLAELTPDPDVI